MKTVVTLVTVVTSITPSLSQELRQTILVARTIGELRCRPSCVDCPLVFPPSLSSSPSFSLLSSCLINSLSIQHKRGPNHQEKLLLSDNIYLMSIDKHFFLNCSKLMTMSHSRINFVLQFDVTRFENKIYQSGPSLLSEKCRKLLDEYKCTHFHLLCDARVR